MPEARKQRIKRLKKLILILLLLFLLLPTVLCMILFSKIASIENKLSELEKNKDNQIEEVLKQVNDKEKGIEEVSQDDKIQLREIEALDNDNIHKVYLTFDDGPSPYTNEILDILKEYGVKATFFVVGREEIGYEKVYQRIVNEGHSIGLHSYSHNYEEIYETLESYVTDLEKLSTLLENITGISPTIVRFPGGSSNEVSNVDMKECINYVNEEGLVYHDWNISSGVTKGLSVDQIVYNSTYQIRSNRVSNILLHDTGNEEGLIKALPKILEKILEIEDTVIVPIIEQSIPIQHRIISE